MPNKTNTSPQDVKHIILCADDFGQSEMISLGILTLASQRRINALSCLVNMPFWSEAHTELEDLQSEQFVGLHLNLTFGQAMSAAWRRRYGDHFRGLPHLIKLAYSRQLDLSVVSSEIQAQIDVFTQDMHIYPDFIDGHQHIHQLPVIRDALIAIYQKQYDRIHGFMSDEVADLDDTETTKPFFLRKTYNGWRDLIAMQGFPKCQALAILGGIFWQRRLAKAKIAANRSFAGLYHFKDSQQYRHHFRKFLTKISDGGLIMCHPGYPSDDQQDPIYLGRHHELHYFMTNEFLEDLKDHAVRFMSKQQ